RALARTCRKRTVGDLDLTGAQRGQGLFKILDENPGLRDAVDEVRLGHPWSHLAQGLRRVELDQLDDETVALKDDDRGSVSLGLLLDALKPQLLGIPARARVQIGDRDGHEGPDRLETVSGLLRIGDQRANE